MQELLNDFDVVGVIEGVGEEAGGCHFLLTELFGEAVKAGCALGGGFEGVQLVAVGEFSLPDSVHEFFLGGVDFDDVLAAQFPQSANQGDGAQMKFFGDIGDGAEPEGDIA